MFFLKVAVEEEDLIYLFLVKNKTQIVNRFIGVYGAIEHKLMINISPFDYMISFSWT